MPCGGSQQKNSIDENNLIVNRRKKSCFESAKGQQSASNNSSEHRKGRDSRAALHFAHSGKKRFISASEIHSGWEGKKLVVERSCEGREMRSSQVQASTYVAITITFAAICISYAK